MCLFEWNSLHVLSCFNYPFSNFAGLYIYLLELGWFSFLSLVLVVLELQHGIYAA